MRMHQIVLILLALVLPACEATAEYGPSPTGASSDLAMSTSGAPPIAESAKAPPVDKTAAPEQTTDRSIIYNATLSLTVADIRTTESTIQHFAEANGGYLQEIAGPSVTIRVPAAKFQSAISTIEHLGELTDRHIEANDVTEEMHDLQIRLDNALHVRDRLTALLEKATKMEDTIAIEKQLEEITQTIELLKGKMQFMQNRVAFSTIRTDLNSTRPQNETTSALPFQWVRELGNGAVAGDTEPQPDTSRLWKRNERFQLPPGFLRYYERDHVTEAMSADDVVIRMQRQDNYDGGDLGFWSKLVRRAIVEGRGIAVTAEQDLTVSDGTAAKLLIGTKDLGAHKATYLVGVVSTKRYVYTFEAWGDESAMKPQIDALRSAFASLDVKHW